MKNNPLLYKNMRILQKKFPAIWRRLNNAGEPPGRKVFASLNGPLTLMEQLGTREIALHSKYDPEREAVRWVESLGKDWDILVLFGLGLGYQLLALRQQFPEQKVILVEKDFNNLFLAINYIDLTRVWKSNLDLIIGPDPRGVARHVGDFLIRNLSKKLLIKALPGYINAYDDYWSVFQHEIGNLLTVYKSHLGAMASFRTQWFLNFRDNFKPYIESPGINSLFDKFHGIPIIIVAAGPSLEKNIHLLPEFRDKALIMAAGSAIGPMLYHDIIPDLLVSYDPTENNYQHFANLDSRNITFAFASTIYAQIVKDYQGPKFSFGLDTFNNWFDSYIDGNKGTLASGATIAVLCFDLALKLGGNPIIFIGQDLAYSDLKTHARGNVNAKEISPEQDGLFLAEGISGPVYTSKSFWAMKLQLERQIEALNKSRLIIDATEGGVKIEGTAIYTLRDVKKYCQKKYPIRRVLELCQQQILISTSEARKLNEALDELRREAKIIYECFHEVTQQTKYFLDNYPDKGLKQSKYEKSVKDIKRLQRVVEKTNLYRYFIRIMMKDRMSITTMHANSKIDKAENPLEKIQYVMTGYSALFKQIYDSAAFLEQEIFPGVAEQIKQICFVEGT